MDFAAAKNFALFKTIESEMSSARNKPNESKSAGSSGSKRTNDEEDDQYGEYLRKKHKFIRSTIRTDYQPDICKDYKNTGFCGFGDSCKFLHDRSDYKAGWQIDQEYEKGQYQDEDDEKYLIQSSDEEDEDDANKCAICNETFKNPVITKCKHIFCSDCADKECSTKCISCQKPTSGIFKNAAKLVQSKQASSNNK